MWQDQRFDAWKTQEYVAQSYRKQANFIRADGILSLFDREAKASDINFLLHPPGYPLVLAAAFELFGDSDSTIQWVSIVADSLSAVVIFFIILEILSFSIALITGFFAAFSPQFSGNSILLLPDVLSILPLLLAVYLLVKIYQKPNLRFALMSGICIGLSCWIRANAMLLAPFLAVLLLFLLPTKRFSFGGVLILSAVLTIAPITIRNLVVYEAFIPLSLGTGQTLLEGIGDYDTDKKFGMPKYDWEVTQQEAEIYNRPDYAIGLISIDGIQRDRQRTMRGLKFIGENPVWFAGVMIHRALWMLTPEKSQIVSTKIPVSRSIEIAENTGQGLTYKSAQIAEGSSLISPQAKTTLYTQKDILILQTDEQKYSLQFLSPDLSVSSNTENVLRLNLVLRQGRVRISVRNANSGNILSSTVVDPNPIVTPDKQTERTVVIPFVSENDIVRFGIANEAPQTLNSVIELKEAEISELGAARNSWTLPFRYLVCPLQKLFSLPILLPLELIGLGILIWRRERKIIFILLMVPLYYFCVQSALHTEHRYILIIHHFLFGFAAIAVVTILNWLAAKINRTFSN